MSGPNAVPTKSPASRGFFYLCIDSHTLKSRLTDTGIGVGPDNLTSIFSAFQQADGSISRKFGGTGLGLSISLQLAHKMGGDIRMTSEEGKGSVFTLYMPLASAAGAGTATPALPQSLVKALPPPAPEAAPGTPSPRWRRRRHAAGR